MASAEWGYYDDARLRELKACADHNGLGITYSIGLEAKYDLASDDPAVRGERHPPCHPHPGAACPRWGRPSSTACLYAGWQALPDHGITLDEKRRKEELALESMSRLMKVAEDCGVLCCEVVSRFEQYLLNTAKEGVEFVKRLGSPNARVLLDTFHMNIEEDSMVDAILEAGPWLGHFHVGGRTTAAPPLHQPPALEGHGRRPQAGELPGAIVMEPFVLMGGTIPYDIKVWQDLSSGAGGGQAGRDGGPGLPVPQGADRVKGGNALYADIKLFTLLPEELVCTPRRHGHRQGRQPDSVLSQLCGSVHAQLRAENRQGPQHQEVV